MEASSHTQAAPRRDPLRTPSRQDEARARIATAMLALPPVFAAIWVGSPAWPLLLAASGVLCAIEYERIALGGHPAEGRPALVAAGLLPLLPDLLPGAAAGAAFWIVAGAAMGAWLVRLWRGSPPGATAVVGHVVAGLLFSGPGLFALAWLRTGVDGRAWVLALLLVTWSNDACAFAVGRALGRHRLAPAISPGKTWEGLVGGLFGSLAATLVARIVLLPSASLAILAVLAAGTATIGPLGDLAKSMLKRAHGVKDSGRLLPGHGGLLDRIDALLWNAVLLAALRAALA